MNRLISRALLTSPLLFAMGAQGPFTLSSSSFQDGAVLQRKFAGNIAGNPNCVGQNVSPQLAWSNVPEGTKSLVFFMVDPEGRAGGGVNHWVAYGIRPERGGFAEGEVSKAPADFVGG